MNKNHQKILGGILHSLPEDIKKSLSFDSKLIDLWNHLTPIQRNEWICWITIVKQPATRVKRLERMIVELKEGKRQPCCWPGCPHRRESAKKWFRNL